VSGPHPEENASWRRLSPRMLLVHPVRELGQAIPALVGLVLAGRAMGDGQMWWLGPAGVAVVIAVSVLRWMTTRYRITPEQVQLRTGLLRRKTIATAADRVRTVDVTASALHRVLGLAKVEIGTGSHHLGHGLELDSLTVREAAGLRAELLHSSTAASHDTARATSLGVEPLAGVAAAGDHDAEFELDTGLYQDTELVRMDPRWVRFAPFTMSGVLGAAAILGIGSRILNQSGVSPGDVGPIRGGIAYVERNPIWLDVLQGLVALVVLVTVLSIGGYALSYWGFRLMRHSHGSLHITRGLLTTRAISIEERRLRGVELAEPLLLRAVHGARLRAITTGLKASSGTDGGSSTLLPPAPRGVAREVAAAILGDPAPVEVALIAHGPAAARRRFTRALLGALFLVVATGLAVFSGAPPWFVAAGMLSIPVAILLAADRCRSLGHAVSGHYLVTRAGSLYRRLDVLECDGIIGWNVRQSFFQRRAGLATLTATTAAGRQRYAVLDVPVPMALALAEQALPGLLGDFLTAEATS
jgi:putative membrane protein